MLANAISLVGNQLALLALPWFVLQTTGSPARVGLTGATEAAGIILSAFFGGALVDRTGFRRSSIIADLAGGAAIALIPLLDLTLGLAFWQLILLVFCVAIFDTPGSTARRGILPDLAEIARLRLERATSFDQAVRNIAALAGPLLAGLLIAAISAQNVLWVDAATFALSAAIVATFIPASAAQVARTSRRYFAELRAGIRFIVRDRVIFTLDLLAVYVNAVGSALFAVILPVFSRQSFGSAAGFGLLIAADAAGGLFGTLGYGAVGHRFRLRPTLVACFLLSFAPLAVLATTPGLALSSILLFVDGIAFGVISTITITTYQERVPGELRGRVFGALLATHRLATPVGVFAAGYLIEDISLTGALIAVAALSLLMPIMVALAPALHSLEADPAKPAVPFEGHS